jgi:hypothetical protein
VSREPAKVILRTWEKSHQIFKDRRVSLGNRNDGRARLGVLRIGDRSELYAMRTALPARETFGTPRAIPQVPNRRTTSRKSRRSGGPALMRVLPPGCWDTDARCRALLKGVHQKPRPLGGDSCPLFVTRSAARGRTGCRGNGSRLHRNPRECRMSPGGWGEHESG